jgi:hypothetical protein
MAKKNQNLEEQQKYYNCLQPSRLSHSLPKPLIPRQRFYIEALLNEISDLYSIAF